jgi:hypothetical protein
MYPIYYLESNVSECVEYDDAAALEPDPVVRVPAGLLFHALRKFALKKGREKVVAVVVVATAAVVVTTAAVVVATAAVAVVVNVVIVVEC